MKVARWWAWSLLIGAIWTSSLLSQASVARAGSPSESTMTAENEQAALQSGMELERSRRWPEAIDLYKKSLESWSENPQLQYALRRSNVQFAIDRRYSDRTFNQMLQSLSQTESLSYLDEVLMKVRQYYVEPISSKTFIAHGTESLYFAMTNEKYAERNMPSASPAAISEFRRMLRDQYWNRPVNDLNHARQTVLEVCDAAERQLGLMSTPVVMEYVFGGCNSLDDYSSFLTPGRLDDLFSNIEGEFVGIGIQMKSDRGKGMLLEDVLPESPAEEGGARAGDWIVAVDGVDCREMTTDEAAGLLQGTPGSRVQLMLVDSETNQQRTAVMIRRAVKVKSVPTAKMIDRANGIGYIRMTGFQERTTQELDAALLQLQREGMRALVWDLRGNPGGLLRTAVDVLDRFLNEGVIVSIKGRNPAKDESYTAHRPGTWNIPLVLLIDGDSASASEIVAGAMRDHHRGTIVGRKSYGKWSVQEIMNCQSRSGLKLTTSKFYSPKGHNYSKVGLEPDVHVELESDPTTAYRGARRGDFENDADIRKGLELLRNQLARR